MTPAEIWTKAIDMTLAQPAGPDALRELADAFDRERDGEIVRAELAKAKTEAALARYEAVEAALARYEAVTSSTRSRS